MLGVAFTEPASLTFTPRRNEALKYLKYEVEDENVARKLRHKTWPLHHSEPNETYYGHGVKIIGWGEEREENGEQVPYWLLANSWGTEFGNKGYFKMLRGENECGIEEWVTAGQF
ncbi:unnamed protein product [Strongylus vulgaris]|uniref:Peptidase C1A papain C-terminal domain-containing protein n=1 Tax=Strongylus vulgaris TaxID=40348 RepID=A0A3P7JAR0_STRVU|nr:unnamed protein product [Strongylus vulgaris]